MGAVRILGKGTATGEATTAESLSAGVQPWAMETRVLRAGVKPCEIETKVLRLEHDRGQEFAAVAEDPR